MRRSFWDVPRERLRPALAVLAAAFASGGLLGFFLAAGLSADGGDALSVYLDVYLTAVRSGTLNGPDPLAAFWESLRYGALCALFGFTTLAALLVPALFFARGFLLSFAAASLACRLGTGGLLLSLAALGIPAFLTVPPLFLLGVQAFLLRPPGAGEKGAVCGRVYLRCVMLCAAAGLLAFLYEYRLAPALLASLAPYF